MADLTGSGPIDGSGEFTVVEVEADVRCCCHSVFPRGFREFLEKFLYFGFGRNFLRHRILLERNMSETVIR